MNGKVVIEATKMSLIEQSVILLKQPYIRSMSSRVKKKNLPFNPIAMQREEEDDGKVVEPKRPSKIKRTTRLDGKVVYKFRWIGERDEEDGEPDPPNLTQQQKEVHIVEEPMKEAPK